MPEIYNNTIGSEERYHVICNVCDRCVYPDHDRINHFRGFQCLDTGFFVCKDCKQIYYHNKNSGVYGQQNKHKYSEVPVVVPWIKVPVFIYEPILFNNQYQLF